MFYIYILLTIIAVGVLLASEAGKQLLKILIILALIAAGAYLSFWIVIIAIGLLSNKETMDSILLYTVYAGMAGFIFYLIYGIDVVYKKYRRGELKKEIIKNKAKDLWLIKWNEIRASKRTSKIIGVLLVLNFFLAVYLLING